MGFKTVVASTALVAVAGLFALDATAPAMSESACNPVSTGHAVVCGSGSGGVGNAPTPTADTSNGGGGFTSADGQPVIKGHGAGGSSKAPAPLTEAPTSGGGGVVIPAEGVSR